MVSRRVRVGALAGCVGMASFGVAWAAIERTFDAEHAQVVQSGSQWQLRDNGASFPLLFPGTGGGGAKPVISTQQAESGTHSMKVQLNPHSNASRSEILVKEHAPLNARHAIGFSIFVPAGHKAPAGSQWEIFSQMWQTPCGSPPVAFDLQPNTGSSLIYRVLIRNDQTTHKPTNPARTIYKGSLPTGRWIQLAMEFNANPDSASRSYFNLWQDRVQVRTELRDTDTIGYGPIANCEYPVHRWLDLRVGLYRGGGYWSATNTLFFDDVRFGDTIGDVMR